MKIVIGLFVLLACITAEAQTRIDLSTQSRHVDFSEALSTRPFKIGSSLPSTCTTGDMFFHTNASPTNVIYACTATNMWMLQSSGPQMNISDGEIGILTRTSDGLVSRTLAAGTGLAIGDGSGQAGNPRISADIASQAESEAGIAAGKLMTPERTRQAFQAWSPLPSQIGKAGSVLTTNGTTMSWQWKLNIPASGTQSLASAGATISADRAYVNVSPSSSLVLTSTPTIVDGSDGQFVTIVNVSATNTLTLRDEATAAGSNLRLGGANLVLGPRQSASLVYSSAVGDWIITQKPGEGGTSAPSAPAQVPTYLTDYFYTAAGLTDVNGPRIAGGWATPSTYSVGVNTYWGDGKNYAYIEFEPGDIGYYRTTIPPNWANGPVTLALDATISPGCGNGTAVTLEASSRILAAGDDTSYGDGVGTGSAAYGSESPLTFITAGAHLLHKSSGGPISTSAWTAGETVSIRLRRSDSNSCYLRLHGMLIGWRKLLQ